MYQVKTEVINQHSKEVSSRATYNANSIHEARKAVRDFVGDANRKKQKIKVWLDDELQYETQDHNPLNYGGGFTDDDLKLASWKEETD